MKSIWYIYKTDLQSVFTTPKLALLVAALMLLPSAYAWINIKAVWDPYSNTAGIRVAVSNDDEGAEVQGKAINVGEDTVKNLKKNPKLGWVFVSRKEAERGVKYGDYYAYLLIPKDFSKKLTSILEVNPQQPVIEFGVNEKINAVAPKIASSGASGITSQISQAFTKTVGDAIFSGFHTAGVELQQKLPSIQNAEIRILELEQALPQIEEMGNKAIELEQKLPDIRQKAQKIIGLKQRIPDIQKAGDSILKVEASLPLVQEAGDKIVDLQGKVADMQRTTAIMTEIETNLSAIEENIKQAIENAKAANDSQADTSGNQEQLARLQEDLVKIHDTIRTIRADLQQRVDQVVKGINAAASFVENDLPAVEQKIHQAATFVRNDLPKLEDDIRKAADLVQEKLPAFEDAVHKVADFARNDLPSFEQKIRNAADQIRKFQGSVNIGDVISFLMHDPQKESSFLANPISLHTKRIYPIPNYGAAMTPLYTMLALWVGGTILISSLPVDVRNSERVYRNHHIYFGRLLTFLTVGVFQAVIIALGNLFLLHVYIVDKLWFVLLAVFISMVFVVITYTLRSVFGNIGNGMALIFLVLQISSSGATFPVSMTSPFFQKISPFMPFTHAVSMLREAVGGMIPEIVIQNALALSVFIIICFGIALLLKRSLSQEVVLNRGDSKLD